MNPDSMTDKLSRQLGSNLETEADLVREHDKAEIGSDPNFIVQGSGKAIDVVAIHGIAGDRQATWSREDSTNSCWINDVIDDGRIIFYGYDTSDQSSKCFTRQGIFEEATKLVQSILGLRSGEVTETLRPLAFLSHGIGGLIVKAALIVAHRDPSRFGDISRSTRVLMFFDYPHRAPSLQALKEHMLWHIMEVFDVKSFPRSHWFQHIETLSDTIHEVNGLFIHTDMLIQAHLINIASASSFKETSEELAFLRIPFERVIQSDKPHKSVTRLSTQMLDKVKSKKSDDWFACQGQNCDFLVLQNLASQVPPIYPLKNARAIAWPFAELDNLLAAQDDRILHVQSDVNTTSLAEHVCHHLMRTDTADRNILYFKFDHHDVRFNSLEPMLRYFLAQLGYKSCITRSRLLTRCVKYIQTLQTYNFRDLLKFWRRYITDDRTEEEIYVLGGLDQCDESLGYLLSELRSIILGTEGRFRLVITSSPQGDTRISEALSDLPARAYQKVRIDADTTSDHEYHQTSFEVAELLHRYPSYCEGKLEGMVSRVIDACGDDTELRIIVLRWLSGLEGPTRILEERLPTLQELSPRLLFEAVVSSIPSQRRPWAKALFNCILVAFRPLRAEEMCLISRLALGSEAEPESIRKVLSHFNGMLILQNDEVKFGHPEIRIWLNTAVGPEPRRWWNYEAADKQHLEILQYCLANLCGETAHPIPYCAQYWTQHYKLSNASSIGSVQSKVMSFFSNQLALVRWMETYDLVGDPFMRPGSRCKQPRTIAAHFGLNEVIDDLEEVPGEEDWSALEEAMRKGHTTTVAKLLPPQGQRFELSDPHLEGLVKAAASAGNEYILHEILMHLPEKKSKPEVELPWLPEVEYPWLSTVLLKACWLGSTELFNATLDLGADLNATLPFDTPLGPLNIAVVNNALGIIESLLARDIDLSTGSGFQRHVLIGSLASAPFDTRELAKLLFDKRVLTPSTYDEDGWTALQMASEWGRPLIANFLLTFHGPIGELVNPDAPAPLLRAAAQRKPRMLQLLLDHGADINSHNSFGNALHYTVRAGHLDMSRRLLERNIDINLSLPGNSSPLLHAVNSSATELVSLLLENNADVEKREHKLVGEGRTPLLLAAVIGDKDVVKLLLDNGADTNARADGWTPLYAAAYYRKVETVRLLLSATKKPDLLTACGDHNWTALHAAYDVADITRLLLDAGANATKTYEAGFSPMELASYFGYPEVLEVMLRSVSDYTDADVLTKCLIGAVDGAHPDVARVLLDAGANVNSRNERGFSLLSISVADSNDLMVRLLLEYRPDLDAKMNESEFTALHCLSQHTPISSLKLMANAGANLGSLTSYKHSPLSTAVARLNLDCAQYLLSKPVAVKTINIPAGDGAPLHRACRMGAPFALIKALVQKGADVNLSCKGMTVTPLAQACLRAGNNYDSEKQMIIKYLLEDCHSSLRGSEDLKISPMHYASYACSAEIIGLFVERSESVQEADSMGRHPIHFACYNSVLAIEALSCSKEAFTIRDKAGRLPIHCAVLSGQVDAVKYVWEKSKAAGLRIDERDGNGWTPLLWTAKAIGLYQWEDDERIASQEDIARYLLDSGADPTSKATVQRETNVAEWSAVDIAVYHGSSSVGQILADRGSKSELKVKGEISSGWCDFCMLRMCGPMFHCKECYDFDFCFKCHESRDVLHPAHEFIPSGPAEIDMAEKADQSNADEKPVHEEPESVGNDEALMNEMGVASDDEEIVSDFEEQDEP